MRSKKMKMNLQFFAAEKNNIKALQETRAEKLNELQLLYAKLEAEQRAITEEEEKQVEVLNKEIEQIDRTIEILDDMKNRLAQNTEGDSTSEGGTEERAEQEAKQFEKYLRGVVSGEYRASELTTGDNGAVIPKTIAKKIIKMVYDISPILQKATKYNMKGTLSVPYYSAETADITMAYKDEFVELESSVGKFTSIELKGYLAGVLTLVSKSLINNSQFDIVSFVVEHMAYNVSRWIEKELLLGTDGKMEGLKGVTKTVTASSGTKITADELIDLQDSVKDVFQNGAIWIMSSNTRSAVRKLKDGQQRYLLQDDITSPFGKILLGKPVYVSDNMPDMEAGKTAVYYGDMSGLAVKITEDLEIQVLREKYATQHAVGIVGWCEMDAKVENSQKIARLKMAE